MRSSITYGLMASRTSHIPMTSRFQKRVSFQPPRKNRVGRGEPRPPSSNAVSVISENDTEIKRVIGTAKQIRAKGFEEILVEVKELSERRIKA
ncbi:hypothetical protein M513_13304 [Trichuris suis]|uniref:Uncharacterized protein n=1 Tax=Trichuris suis TaxID=68888 RepID=A0A085LLH7_9BILA|nr:hypothetical protein M513_13304 [Trichuris suis]